MRVGRTSRRNSPVLNAQETAGILGTMSLPGSRGQIATAGEINANDKQDLMHKLAEIAGLINSGAPAAEHAASTREMQKARREALEVAWNDPTGNDFRELGAAVAAEITSRVERSGFMRRILDRADVGAGSIPRIRMKEPQVEAIVAIGATQVHHQVIRGKYFYPAEFNIVANPRATEIDLIQGSDDLLEDMRLDGEEAILVTEDRLLLKALNAGAGVWNETIYFTGQLTPAVLAAAQRQVEDWRLPASNALISMDLLSDITTGTAFSEWFDPVSKLEIVTTGRIGTLLGMTISTDGYRDPNLRVLGNGELIVSAMPSNIGAFSDRGPIQAEPRINDKDFPGRGWFMYEIVSMSLVNMRGVARAKRV